MEWLCSRGEEALAKGFCLGPWKGVTALGRK